MIEASLIGLATAFAAGVVSFLSPCVLPLVPGYVSYIASPHHSAGYAAGQRGRLSALAMSAFFVLGFGAVFVTLGASATAIGQLALQYRQEANVVGGAIIIVFGLVLLGLTSKVLWLQRDLRFHPRLAGGHPANALVLGAAFGFGWTPCIGPILGAILTAGAVEGSVGGSISLLVAYALGLGLPFLVVAIFLHEALGRLKALRRIGVLLQRVAGVILVLVGVAMITGKLAVASIWFLEAFPALGRLG